MRVTLLIRDPEFGKTCLKKQLMILITPSSNPEITWELVGIFFFFFFFKDQSSLTPEWEIDWSIYLPKIYAKSTVGYNCPFLFTQPYRQKIRGNTTESVLVSCCLYLAHPFPFDFFFLKHLLSTILGLGSFSLWELFPRTRQWWFAQGHTLVTTNFGAWPLKSILFSLHHAPLWMGLL